MNSDYQKFIESKRFSRIESGFNVDVLPDYLFKFQDFLVKKALKAGRYALFEDCGLGKTIQQLVWSQQVVEKTNKPLLVLAPLAVSSQTIAEGERFGIEVRKLTNQPFTGVNITNYEQLDNVNPLDFSGIVIDESSILKNHEGAIRTKVIDGFKDTPYKLACTATPSPNDPMELGNHSEFLNVMGRNEMLAMYFVHDGGDTAKWRLKGHSRKVFWRWVNTWATMLSKPSDIGFDDSGYHLPQLNYIEKTIVTKMREPGQLFNDVSISATDFNSELRITKIDRLSEVVDIVNNSKENFIIWIKQNEEGEYLRKLIPDAIEVKGSDLPEYKERVLLGFAKNEFRVLITKKKIASFGMNYQNCHNQIFPSLDFSFEGLYQSIRRSYRFGQNYPVNIWLITTDTMRNVVQTIKNKQLQFEEMQREMTLSMNEGFKHQRKIKTQSESIKIPNFLYGS